MTPEELNAKAMKVATQAAQLSPKEGDQFIRDNTQDFPDGIKALLLTISAQRAEEKRNSEAKLKMATSNNRHERSHSMKILNKSTSIGIGLIVVALTLLFAFPHLTPAQWFGIRLMLVIAVCLLSNLLSGALNVKGNVGRFAIAATAGFAMFVILYFWNPPSLPPVEQPVKAEAPK